MHDSNEDRVPQITLRIPGGWASPRDLIERMRAADAGFEVSLAEHPAGDSALVDASTGRRFRLETAGPDGEIADVFAGNPRLTDAEMAALADHDVKLFVSGPGGSVAAAQAVMRAGAAVVRAGGLGVLVDNSGACHGPGDWLKLADDEQGGGVYWGLVGVTGSDEEVFSTGMHCLGHRDAELPGPIDDLGSAGYLVHNFLGYSYASGEILTDGGPLPGWDGPPLRLRHADCVRFPPGSPFYNPYGVWELGPADD